MISSSPREMLMLLLLLLLGWVGQMDGASYQPNCSPGYATDDELDFAEPPGNYGITCNRAFYELICCIKGYKSIKWYRENNGTWTEIKPNRDMYYQENDLNQTLTIQNPKNPEDEGSYMCVAEDRKNNRINNTIMLDIRSCDGERQPPEAIDPPERTIASPLGSMVHIRCRAFFGRAYEKSYSDIYWTKEYYNSTGHPVYDTWVPQNGFLVPNDTNINITYEAKPVHIYSSFIIYNITEDDYANYKCKMLNVFGTKYSTTTLVEVNATVSPTLIFSHVKKTWKLAVIVIIVLVAAMLITGLLVYCFLLDIKLFLRDRFAKVVDDGKECDAFIVYNSNDNDDREFVTTHMINVLEKQNGYKLFLEDRDFPVGIPIANNYMLGVKKSRCIMFLMSPALLSEAWVYFLYQSTAKRTDISRVFLIYRQVDDSDWQRQLEDFKTAFKVAKHKVKWTDDQSSLDESSLPSQNSSTSYSTMSKQEIKFWKQLRLHLPKPLSLVRMQQSNLISNTNLNGLESQSSKSSQKPLVETKPTMNGFDII